MGLEPMILPMHVLALPTASSLIIAFAPNGGEQFSQHPENS